MRLEEFFSKGYLLVIDDISSMRKTIKSMLRHIGINNVREADDGDSALKLLETQQDCKFILLDWNMPRVPGIQVIQELRAREETQDIPILMVTAETGREEVAHAAEVGVNGFIVKPFVSKTLMTKIEEIIAARTNPPEHVKLLKTGQELMRQGEYVKAFAMLQKAKYIRETARVHVSIGDVHDLRGDPHLAHGSYDAGMALNPMFLKAYTRSANLYLKQGNKDGALGALLKAANISPANADRHMTIGKIHMEKGDEKKAREAFSNAIKRDADKAGEIAEEMLNSGKTELAEQYFRTSLKKQSDNIHIYNRLGIALRRQGKWKEAIQEYLIAVKIDPNDSALYFNMGKAYLEGKQVSEAKRSFQKALDLTPDLAEARKELETIAQGTYWD